MKIRRNNRGFTLIELLVVLAISMVLMGLVLYPVAQSFKMTRSAQAMVESQDAARTAMEQISRDLGEAMDVVEYENADPLQIPVLQKSGSVQYLDAPSAKIDFVLPKMLAHCNNPNHPSGEPRDFDRGDEALPSCPVCESTDVEIRPKLPLEQDTKVVRYFLGLMYNNPNPHSEKDGDPTLPDFGWLSPWGKNVEAGQGNQVVLYRVEFDPYDTTLQSNELPNSLLGKYNNDRVLANLCDPQFFYRGDTWKAWASKVRIVGVGKYEDLVDGVDSNGDGDWDSLTPCITFDYKKMDNDNFSGTYSTDQSFEYPDSVASVYQAEYGYWMPDYDVSVYRYTYGSDGSPSNVVSYSLTTSGNDDVVIDKSECTLPGGSWTDYGDIFNITQYLDDLNDGRVNSGTIDSRTEMAFTIDSVRGRINFAIIPPMPDGASSISDLDPHQINNDYELAYKADRGTARRYAKLSTFDPDNVKYYLQYAAIVPGSERVVGPDMTPDSDHGYVAYQRVPFALGEPGYNQYKINYDTGDIIFSPVYDQKLPEGHGNIRVDYKVHFNQDGDVVRGDYQTKAAVVVHLQMKMYDPESAKPHSVDLTNTIKIRNALR